MADNKKEISNKRKAAIFLLTIGPERAAKILKNLSEEEIESLTLEIANLKNISESERQEALREFSEMMQAKEYINKGGIEYAKEVLEKALGPQKAYEIIGKLTSNLQVKPFDFMKKSDVAQLVNFLQNEHPQTIALVLAYLEPKQAAQIIISFPEELQAEVIKRLSLLERASPEVVKQIEKNMEKRLSSFVTQDFSNVGGIDVAVEIVNALDRTAEKRILDDIQKTDPDLAEEIKKRMFVFEDILQLDDRSVQLIMREVDTHDLALAIKGTTEEVKNKLMSNMSKRAAALLEDELKYMGPVRVKDVEAAQQKIVAIVRKLEDAGEIVISHGGGEDIIV
ncbi:flagellar motor switch protein FliG [Athalassotoga saccharophila]|uniref:flagellar motor switch protein FliG n=1 Tax=Athalassotoga saccharophila TaxID=1441386 RepID=UPI00137B48E0|nr:flagellar motor switch protein FliG [Athalassotoga saccharophila]BBJ27827.1 flagellar motor switch protein FliG [Athalassotoga saccharophila]